MMPQDSDSEEEDTGRRTQTHTQGESTETETESSQRAAPFRYTPVTALSPKEFPSSYGGRMCLNTQTHAEEERADKGIESLIVITMYNEGADMLVSNRLTQTRAQTHTRAHARVRTHSLSLCARLGCAQDETLDGICDNIAHDCAKSGDRDAWKRWAVCIVADGRQKMSKGVAEQDFYDANTAQLALEMAAPGEGVRVHLFEGTRERSRPRRIGGGGKLHAVCCCCRSRRPAWCCARDVEPAVDEAASQSSAHGDTSWTAPQQRLTRERIGPSGSGQYRTGPTYIEHLPEASPEGDSDGSPCVAGCVRRCSACGCCRQCADQQRAAGSVPDTGLYPPLQMILAVKEENAGKLDSHLWFFDAFADSLKPVRPDVHFPVPIHFIILI